MVEKKNVVIIREAKEVVFGILKDAAPALFGDKTWADVVEFRTAVDQSKFEIVFEEDVA